jgi:hypothetical protein
MFADFELEYDGCIDWGRWGAIGVCWTTGTVTVGDDTVVSEVLKEPGWKIRSNFDIVRAEFFHETARASKTLL